MGGDEVEEHNEAMNLIDCPHKVQVSIACRNLPDLDAIGKSDPYCILYAKAEKDIKWTRMGRTETIAESLDPNFAKIFQINYKFERNQVIKVEVFDEDSDDDELIGNCEVFLNKILTAKNQTYKDELFISQKKVDKVKKGGRGKIFLTANSVNSSNDVAKMDIICHILDIKKKEKKGFLCFCKPPEDNPFLVIER